MEKSTSERSKDIEIIIRQRDRLITACSLLNWELSKNRDVTVIQNFMIRIAGILSNIGGFCDNKSVERIESLLKYFGAVMIDTDIDSISDSVRLLLPFIAGFKVNFNKRPFEVINFNIGQLLELRLKKR